jgi:hypothetical protein
MKFPLERGFLPLPAYRSQTRQSRLFGDVKVYIIECDLVAEATTMIPTARHPR